MLVKRESTLYYSLVSTCQRQTGRGPGGSNGADGLSAGASGGGEWKTRYGYTQRQDNQSSGDSRDRTGLTVSPGAGTGRKTRGTALHVALANTHMPFHNMRHASCVMHDSPHFCTLHIHCITCVQYKYRVSRIEASCALRSGGGEEGQWQQVIGGWGPWRGSLALGALGALGATGGVPVVVLFREVSRGVSLVGGGGIGSLGACH